MVVWPRAVEGLVMTAQFWDGRRVLLTGHTGFKGAWLALWLKQMGARVAGYALPPENESLYELNSVANEMDECVYEDVRNTSSINQLISRFRPEVVFHLAAQSLVRASYSRPLETYQVNILGTANVLEAVRLNLSQAAVVIVTSDKCYENNEWVWGYRETDALGGHDPYSSSKSCADIVAAAYFRSFFGAFSEKAVGVATARAGNVIGGGDFSKDRLVPDVVASLSNGLPLRVRNPASVRPWQHVLEPLSGYILLAEKLWLDPRRYSQSWNFGPAQDDARTVRWLVEQLHRLWGTQAHWEADSESSPHEANLLLLDSAKARALLGWRPRWTVDVALRAVVEWYKAYEARVSLRDVVLRQIRAFESMTHSANMSY